MNQNRTKNIISLVLNTAMVVLVAIAIAWFFTEEGFKSGVGNMKSGGYSCFIFFTNDSNIFAALCSLILLPFNIKAFKSGNLEFPKWAMALKLVGTTAVSVTLMVVLLFLGPNTGYKPMFEGSCLYLHLICPLLSIISFGFFEKSFKITAKQALFGVLPTLVYGTVYLINVIFAGVWSDFYGFNIGGFWYISYVVIMAFAYLLAFLLCKLHNCHI